MSKNEQLINTAIAALAAGRKETARRILTNVVTNDPGNQQAWLCLAASVPPNLAIPALQKVLVLNPQNKMALQSIGRLRAQPEKELDLADVLVGENQAGEALLASFGQEPPTIYEPGLWKEQIEPKAAAFGEDSTLAFNSKESKKLITRLSETPLPKPPEPTPAPEMSPRIDDSAQNSASLEASAILAATFYPKTTQFIEAKSEPYIKANIPLNNSSAVAVNFVSGNRTALNYMELNRSESTRLRLKERPLRRNNNPKRTLVQLTNFGIIVITALLVIIIGYLLLMLLGI